MNSLHFQLIVLVTAFLSWSEGQKPIRLFDGKSFRGWEGDTIKTWRIRDGALVGGSLTENVPHNDFLVTTRSYGNFLLRLKLKLEGRGGFENAGIQFHSKRLTNPPYEMTGYQADAGARYWGGLYDESRRNKTLVAPDSVMIKKLVRLNDWNDVEVRSENGRIRISWNGRQTVDYTEPDKTIPQSGLIGLQIHGGGKAQVSYKDITLQELR